jgi:adenine/guanine phosphoribosyltransferase-like PRPP-binding protein
MSDLIEKTRTAVALIALVAIAGGAFVGANAFIAVLQ